MVAAKRQSRRQGGSWDVAFASRALQVSRSQAHTFIEWNCTNAKQRQTGATPPHRRVKNDLADPVTVRTKKYPWRPPL